MTKHGCDQIFIGYVLNMQKKKKKRKKESRKRRPSKVHKVKLTEL